MKGFRLLFNACLAAIVLNVAYADDAADVARAARRGATPAASNTSANTATQSQSRQQRTPSAQASATNQSGATVSRTTTVTRDPVTTPVAQRDGMVTNRNATTPSVQSRGTVSRTTTTPAATAARTGVSGNTRGAITASRTATVSRTATPTRVGTSATRTATTTANPSRISRAATNTARAGKLTREEIMTRNYSACKDVYYECMDEFCGNKDSQLKRCACSSRVNEFDKVKKQLAAADEKMLDFSQRLLTVSMDKEDAAALNTATEGELAFQQKDVSASKKLLDQIAKKLNTSFDSNTFDTGANALSWSLNVDAAFDTVDSMLGASTTSKTGTALYSAALPVCREIALEVCSEDELDIATNGYLVAIEQDCNTVYKTYETQVDQARERVHEGAALLEISRLDTYQKRNSDDILTCKQKMLNMMYDTSVCGAGLGKCLDTTGRYIDPSTGTAFLTTDLVNLGNLIVRPTGEESWTSASGNQAFVAYLYSKKKFLDPATEHCRDIADLVWDDFIEDALAQIKLAQDAKLEEVRQSCTTLTTQCLSTTAQSIADFDSRALSTFGVAADKTVNAMCADITNACTAVLQTSGGGNDWIGGMSEIATDKTYDTILQTCREVGRACIIQACRSISGNFGLCEPMDTSNNRKSIINKTSCWSEVYNCVASAGADQITNIIAQLSDKTYERREMTDGTFYDYIYGAKPDQTITNEESVRPSFDDTECFLLDKDTTNCIYDQCAGTSTTLCGCTMDGGVWTCDREDSLDCKICRITERIWGNCEAAPNTKLHKPNSHNRIKAPATGSPTTLLYWLAENTGTAGRDDSCRSTMCGLGFVDNGNNDCVAISDISYDCPDSCTGGQFSVTRDNKKNCCNGTMSGTNCCATGADDGICIGTPDNNTVGDMTFRLAAQAEQYGNKQTFRLACIGTGGSNDGTVSIINGQIACNGRFVLVSSDGYYFDAVKNNGANNQFVTNSIKLVNDNADCMATPPATPVEYKYQWDSTTGNWGWIGTNNVTLTNVSGWTVSYGN